MYYFSNSSIYAFADDTTILLSSYDLNIIVNENDLISMDEYLNNGNIIFSCLCSTTICESCSKTKSSTDFQVVDKESSGSDSEEEIDIPTSDEAMFYFNKLMKYSKYNDLEFNFE